MASWAPLIIFGSLSITFNVCQAIQDWFGRDNGALWVPLQHPQVISFRKQGVPALVILIQTRHTLVSTRLRISCLQVANLSALQKQLEQRVKTLGPLLSPRAQPAVAAEQKASVGPGAGGGAAPMQGVQPQLGQQQLHAQQQSMSQMFPAGFEATMAAMQVCGAQHGFWCSSTVVFRGCCGCIVCLTCHITGPRLLAPSAGDLVCSIKHIRAHTVQERAQMG